MRLLLHSMILAASGNSNEAVDLLNEALVFQGEECLDINVENHHAVFLNELALAYEKRETKIKQSRHMKESHISPLDTMNGKSYM